MQKTKINILLIAFLALMIVFSFSVVFANEENEKQVNDKQVQVNDKDKDFDNNEIKDDDVDDDNEVDEEKNVTGEEHRSAVSKFVKGISDVADREEGVGEEVKAIAKEQNSNKDNDADAIEKIKNRSKIKTFLIGTDYKNIGQLRSEIVKTENNIKKLENLLDKLSSDGNKTDLQTEIQKYKEEQQKLEAFLKANESKFSLFGWFVKLFVK